VNEITKEFDSKSAELTNMKSEENALADKLKSYDDLLKSVDPKYVKTVSGEN